MADALYLSKLNVNGQEYQIKDANALTAADYSALAFQCQNLREQKVQYAEYDSESQSIKFYNGKGGIELFTIDATDFIKDGMVSDVAISNGNLVITFNTDAGHNAISIPLTDIFNPANYYTKTQVNGFLADAQTLIDAKANSADLATVATTGSYNDLADKPVIPEGAVVDAALSDTSVNAVQNKVVKAALDAKADASSVPEHDTYAYVEGEVLYILSGNTDGK